MKARNPWPVAAALAAALLAGCGGRSAAPSAFGTDNQAMLARMIDDLKAKNADGVKKKYETFKGREKADAEEKAAFERIKTLVDKGDWAGAQKYAEACQAASR